MVSGICVFCALVFLSCTENKTIVDPDVPGSQLVGGAGVMSGTALIRPYPYSLNYPQVYWQPDSVKDGIWFEMAAKPDILISPAIGQNFNPSNNNYDFETFLSVHSDFGLISSIGSGTVDSTVVPDNYAMTDYTMEDQSGFNFPVFFESTKGNWGIFYLDTLLITTNDWQSLLVKSWRDTLSIAISYTIRYHWRIQENGTRRIF
jgi:hypothetical protein